jgi:hypothetical protein
VLRDAPLEVIVKRPTLPLEGDQGPDIEAVAVGERSLRVAGRDQDGPFFVEEPRRMPAHRAEPLDRDAGRCERQSEALCRHFDRHDEPEPGGADRVERDAAEFARQADGAPRFILDPSHRQFVGPHVGPGT